MALINTNRALFIVEQNKEKEDEICLQGEAPFNQVQDSVSITR